MTQSHTTSPSVHFYAVGLSYKKAAAEVRGKFSLSSTVQEKILDQAAAEGLSNFMIISTCNRTELYGFAPHPFVLISLLCQHSQGTLEEFQSLGYIHKNNDAIHHMFHVGTGMDSQILGDFEIIGQIKKSFIQAKAKKLASAFLERLVNAVIQASKRIKNETQLSTGATSVAYASVHYIQQHVPHISDKNIVLYGAGDIGRATCENLLKHTKNKHITLINRTQKKALKVAQSCEIKVQAVEFLETTIAQADLLIVATGASTPTICANKLQLNKPLLILDLSVPKNVAADVLQIDGVKLVHLDTLSQLTDATLENRKKDMPKALKIIEEVQADFLHWNFSRTFAPTLQLLKNKLEKMMQNEVKVHQKKGHTFDEAQAHLLSDRIIHKITTQFANHLRKEPSQASENMQWIEKVFQLETLKHE